tara:strand:- start:11 stop:475 length:465 start_codon:yes stop_codon:yes gene_type:complete
MASFDFPNTPSNGQSYTANGITYTFDGTAWKRETGAVKGQKGEIGAGTKGQKGDEGFLANNGQSSSYTLVASDDQKLINTNSNVTVPSGVFSASDAVTIVNNSTSSISIVQASGVAMYYAGTSTTGTRVLAEKGIATIVCISSNNFIISGAGLS